MYVFLNMRRESGSRMVFDLYHALLPHAPCTADPEKRDWHPRRQEDGTIAYPPGLLRQGDALRVSGAFLLAPYALPTSLRIFCRTEGLEGVLGGLLVAGSMLWAGMSLPEGREMLHVMAYGNLLSLGYEGVRGILQRLQLSDERDE